MMKKKNEKIRKGRGMWVQSVKCWNCNKTGKVEDPNKPEKQVKCTVCDNGYIRTKGMITS